MTALIAEAPEDMPPEQRRSMYEQIQALPSDAAWIAVYDEASRTVFVRSLEGVPKALVQLWKRHPSMLVPDAPGRRHAGRTVNLDDL